MPRTISWILTVCVCLTACRREQAIVLSVDFGYEVVNGDYSVPVYISFSNKTSGALFYKWTFEGGTPETYDEKEPGVILFSQPARTYQSKAGSLE